MGEGVELRSCLEDPDGAALPVQPGEGPRLRPGSERWGGDGAALRKGRRGHASVPQCSQERRRERVHGGGGRWSSVLLRDPQ